MSIAAAASLCAAAARPGRIVLLTGAGISAESGIPTFRGQEGYWTVGAREYHPQELATYAAFQRMPWDVWAWYLYRRGVCRGAEPNPAHRALVALEHARSATASAWSPRTSTACTGAPAAPPPHVRDPRQHRPHALRRRLHARTAGRSPRRSPAIAKGETAPPALRAAVLPALRRQARPHVLWFDESYDEPRYHLDTARARRRGRRC